MSPHAPAVASANTPALPKKPPSKSCLLAWRNRTRQRANAATGCLHRRGLLKRNGWLIARRSAQIAILALFLAGPWLDVWWVKGNLASSTFLDVIGLTDPLVLLQSFVAGHELASAAVIGALSVLALYLVVGGRAYCSWVCPINVISSPVSLARLPVKVSAMRNSIS